MLKNPEICLFQPKSDAIATAEIGIAVRAAYTSKTPINNVIVHLILFFSFHGELMLTVSI